MVMFVRTILDDNRYELEIKNSKFIALIYKVKTKDEIKMILERVRKEYKDATHYCFAYIIDDMVKSSDDGEPGGTAGMPILQVLQKQELNYVLGVVVRYFGGIKLGAGGLVRAYTKSISLCLENANVRELREGYHIILEIEYSYLKELDYLLRNSIINSKEYNNKIRYDLDVSLEMADILEKDKNIIIVKKTNKYVIDNIY